MRKQIQKILPPDGGWGYLVALSIPLAMNVTLMPSAAFGLLFGRFLSNIGDETTGTVLTMSVLDASFSFTGFLANGFLNKFSYRKVALIGVCTFSLGSISVIFVQNLWHMILFYGVVQGIGAGLMLPAFYTALNSYFDTKIGIMNGLIQTATVGGTIALPAVEKWLLDSYGFRGALIFLAALSLHAIVAASVLQPVKWHMKKVPLEGTIKCSPEESDALLLKSKDENLKMLVKSRLSVVSINTVEIEVPKLNPDDGACKNGFWKSLAKDFDMTILKDPHYLNLAIGVSLGFVSDVSFISILPLVLVNGNGFNTDEATRLLTLFFATNLIGTLVLSLVSAFFKPSNRHLFYLGVVVSAIFRTLFSHVKGYWWTVFNLSVLGFFRALIQTPIVLVFADNYPDRFSTAYSLSLVVCGIVSLIIGFSSNLVKTYTGNNVSVIHLLTSAFIVCAISWPVEIAYTKLITRKDT